MEKLVHSDSKALYHEGLRDALKGIYEVYGSDLTAFFRDASDQSHAHEDRLSSEKSNPSQKRRRATPVRKIR